MQGRAHESVSEDPFERLLQMLLVSVAEASHVATDLRRKDIRANDWNAFFSYRFHPTGSVALSHTDSGKDGYFSLFFFFFFFDILA